MTTITGQAPDLSTVGNATGATDPDRQLWRWTGTSGVIAVVMLAIFLGISSSLGVDPLSATPSALSHSLTMRIGASLATAVILVSAFSYVPLIAFFAGLRGVIAHLDDTGVLAGVIGIAAPLFLAGAVASDGFNLALVVAEHSVATLTPSSEIAQVFAAGWQVCLVEAQVALATICAASAIAVLRADTETTKIIFPGWIGIWGLVGALMVVPLAVAPGLTPIFVLSNLARFGWILAVSVLLLRGARRSAAVRR